MYDDNILTSNNVTLMEWICMAILYHSGTISYDTILTYFVYAPTY